MPKRKTTTSTEVKRRYNEKTYKRYQIYMRIEEDADAIAYIEEEKQRGANTSEIFRAGIEKLKNEG